MNEKGQPLYPKRPRPQVKQLKDENIFVRYPRQVLKIGVTVAILLFFSKPIYSMFFGPPRQFTEFELRRFKRQRRDSSRALDELMGYTDEEINAHFKELDEEEERQKLNKNLGKI